jgi:serine phosphatase RsbU (regulator of sigma subunit)/CHASE2 domain-containing sensor protein
MSPLRRGRVVGVVVLISMVAVMVVPGIPGRELLRFAWFDALQRVLPRERVSGPVVIVEVEGKSLARYGQWPWPRTLLASLIDRVLKADAAAVGIDIVMPEADRLSPQYLPRLIPAIDRELAARLAALPSNDTVLATAIHDRPVVLGVAGVNGGTGEAIQHAPARAAPLRAVGGDPATYLWRYDGMFRSIDEVDRAAMGHGLLNTEPEGRAVRRVPLAAMVNGVAVPTLAMELYRVASGEASVTVAVGTRGIRDVAVGSLVVPTQGDGSVWLRYTRESRVRFVSAADVLSGVVAPATFERKLVLIGVTALGLADRRPIPGGGARDGVEIHAELIESIFDGAVLARPGWSGWAEAAFLLVAGVIVIAAVPVMRVRAAWIVLLPLLVLDVGGSLVLFHRHHRLLDAGTPGLGLIVLFTVMLSVTLAEAERQRRALRRQVERQREAAARFEGELLAARRIQLGILPKPADLLAGERRFGLHIVLEPAREVGGDLYDFFMLDRDRLFFLLGDVSGKGLPGSLFMAVSKSLYKSTALRRGAAVATMMQEANVEISRDNPEALFVTLFAAVLDVNTGVLEYCNAGHDRPYVVPRGGGSFTQLTEAGGPPLCVLDDFPYTAATHRLQPGDTLCLITDGVTEARTASGELFGRERLEARLAAIGADTGAEAIATTIGGDVARFVAGAEPADDLAILVVRWNGPPATSGR